MSVQKRHWTDLAVFGGEPTFREKLHVGRPNIGSRDRLIERINAALSGRWLSNDGPLLIELEQRISHLLGVGHCIATCNGTIGLEIAIKALGLAGEVIVPSFTFAATAHALQWLGITPVFCDVDRHSHNIDPAQVERMVTPSTKGIMGVHLWGRPCDVDALAHIAETRGIPLLFDAAHAFACSHKGSMIGNFGSAEVFSFHATKFVNTFEGGAIVTNSDALAARARAIRNFGFARQDETIDAGTNGKMHEISAAMGLTALESLDDFVKVNYSNYKRYQAELTYLPGVRFMTYDEGTKCNYQYVVLEIDEAVTQITRDQVLHILHAENVLARRYFYPGCHRLEPYRSRYPGAQLQLPITDLLANRVLVLPTGTSVGPNEVRGICEIIRLAVLDGRAVRERLLDPDLSQSRVPYNIEG